MIITFDIETIPTQSPEFIADIASGIKPPATMKKAETIAQWVENEKQQAVDDAVLKTSFDGAYGQICCIGWAIDDSDVFYSIGSESEIINEFFDSLYLNNPRNLDPIFVGHNVSAFDLRFLFQRAIILGIKPPSFIPFNAKSWDSQIFDTMTYFAGFGNRISLDKLCKVLGIEGKTGMDGSDVWPEYQAGNIDKIAEYCRHDVEITRAVYKRLTFSEI
ncbi:MAG: ribonuclease H-like domain-containing protein [Paludibacter sp.]|nr:ribonuclease H-like domain-containing protein [Paludibacter sp.]